MSEEAAISRSVLSDQVKDRLLQAILAGRYPPGARIVETRVARELGTSQAPVREALRDLEALGMVETSAFRGARVRRPTADELLEAFIVRSELEVLGANLAIASLTDGDLDALAEDIEAMRRAARDGDLAAEVTADAAFHGRIVALSANRALGRVWRYLEPSSRTYITLVVPGADRERVTELHPPVLEALRARDPEAAALALRRHFVEAGAMLARLWSDAPPGSAGESPDPADGLPLVRRPA